MDSYKKAWKTIVQPPQCSYEENKDLPTEFVQKKEMIRRHKIIIPSCDPDEHINVHFYHSEERSIKHILIYLHSFSGSAIEGYFLLEHFLPYYSIILYDQRGCGNNKSEYVTLGLRESIDLNLIIQHIQQRFGEVNIYLWGRSMGSAAIIHFLHQIEASIFYFQYRMAYSKSSKNLIKLKKMNNFLKYKNDEKKSKKILKKIVKQVVYPLKKLSEQQFNDLVVRYSMIQRVVYDSPFCSSHNLIKQIMIQHSKVNKIMAELALMPVAHSVKTVLGYDVLGQNKPYLKTGFIQIPGMFLIGEKDELIDFKRFKDMFDQYASPEKKLRIMLKQDHGTKRNDDDIKAGKIFLMKNFKDEYEKKRVTVLQMEVQQNFSFQNVNDEQDKQQDNELNKQQKNELDKQQESQQNKDQQKNIKTKEQIQDNNLQNQQSKEQNNQQDKINIQQQNQKPIYDDILTPKELDISQQEQKFESQQKKHSNLITIDRSEDSGSDFSDDIDSLKEFQTLQKEVQMSLKKIETEDLKQVRKTIHEFKD